MKKEISMMKSTKKAIPFMLALLLAASAVLTGCAKGGLQGTVRETLVANADGSYVPPENTDYDEPESSSEANTPVTPTQAPTQKPTATPEPEPEITVEVVRASNRNYSGYTVAKVRSAYSSSELHQPDGTDNSAKMACDGNEITSWQEGVDGYGEGEELRFVLDTEYSIRYICIKTGNWRTPQIYSENTRPKELSFWLDNDCYTVTIPDGQVEYCIDFGGYVKASEVSIIIESVYKNAQWDDTCISEVTIYAGSGSSSDSGSSQSASSQGGASSNSAGSSGGTYGGLRFSESDYENGYKDEQLVPVSSGHELFLTFNSGGKAGVAYEGGKEYVLTNSQFKTAMYEIYARHGMLFNDSSVQSYFDGCSWYYGYIKESNFKDSYLSDIEKNNVKVLEDASK